MGDNGAHNSEDYSLWVAGRVGRWRGKNHFKKYKFFCFAQRLISRTLELTDDYKIIMVT